MICKTPVVTRPDVMSMPQYCLVFPESYVEAIKSMVDDAVRTGDYCTSMIPYAAADRTISD